jgi:hypothetical protein
LIEREMNWHLKCPIEHSYPRLVYTTFMDGNYDPLQRSPSFIPCPQNGMGIISYLKYCAYSAKAHPKVLAFARAMGDYLVKETLTPATGEYPRFTRSTWWRAQFPFRGNQGSPLLRSSAPNRARALRQYAGPRRHALALALPRGLSRGRRARRGFRQHELHPVSGTGYVIPELIRATRRFGIT